MLIPRTPDGHQSVVLADACSGKKSSRSERWDKVAGIFANLSAMIQRLEPPPEFLCFAGDAIWGYAGFGNGTPHPFDEVDQPFAGSQLQVCWANEGIHGDATG